MVLQRPTHRMAELKEFGARAIKALAVSDPVRAVLLEIQSDMAEAYRESFLTVMETMARQESRLERIQETLTILVSAMAPQLSIGDAPAAFRIARDGEAADVASALVVADPIGSGYTLSQRDLAEALALPATDVSTLSKAFKLSELEHCAVVVRRGPKREIVNYHRRAIAEFRRLVNSPPNTLPRSAQHALRRARVKLVGST